MECLKLESIIFIVDDYIELFFFKHILFLKYSPEKTMPEGNVLVTATYGVALLRSMTVFI